MPNTVTKKVIGGSSISPNDPLPAILYDINGAVLFSTANPAVVQLAAGSANIGVVDTELPAAAALGDATANPTAPAVGSMEHIYNGTTWDRLRSDGTGGATGRLGTTMRRSQAGTTTLTIANGATTSDAMDARGFAILGLVMPGTFTGTSITFTVSDDNATFQALYDVTNAQVSLTVAASRSYDLPAELASWPYWKVVSGSAEGGSRSLKIVAKG